MYNTNSTGNNTLINNSNKSLKIMQLNACSIKGKAKMRTLEIFLNENKPDALFLSETHLTHRDNPKIKDYNVIRTDRTDKKKGGTAITLKKSIQFNDIDSTPTQLNLQLSKLNS